MAKRKRISNIEDMIQKVDVQGIVSEYKHWIKIYDVHYLGEVIRGKGIKINRQHELL